MNQIDWKELWKKCFGKEKDERAHATAMLAIYGIFIIILVIVVRTGGTTTESENKTSVSSPTPTEETTQTTTPSQNETQIDSFEINYSYIYTIQNNDQKEVFTGKKIDDKEIFTIINGNGSESYAKLSDNYLKKENGEYHLIDIPSNNLIYADVEKIISLTEQGTLTKNNNIYTYQVPTNEVIKMYNSDSSIVVDNNLMDTIVMTTDGDTLKTIDINFNNYQTIINNNTPSVLEIKMEFNNVGTTENFDVTISN